ncbi:hypothetical protein BGX28_007932 [Mortierella sp. GBA30]|nr:hypothetical protein BGX28_007932 [Mortierella sp. GBA30]
MKQSNLTLLVAILGASVLSSNTTPVDAAPIQQQQHPQPSTGRVQIKPHSPSAPFLLPPPTPRRRSYLTSRRSISASLDNILANVSEPSLPRPIVASSWYHGSDRHLSSLEGHVVVDEDDDDAGNELLDTEDDGLPRPDEDDTIEGQILEEEEDEEDEEDEDEDDINQQNPNHLARLPVEASVSNMKDWVSENGLEEGDLVPEDFDNDEDDDEDELQEEGVPEDEEDEDEEEEDEDEDVEEGQTKFGGEVAAADMAAGEP